MMPNNIKKRCQTYQIEKSIFSVIFHWDPLYSAVPEEQILVLTRNIWFLVFSDSGNRFGHMRKVRPQIYSFLAHVEKKSFFAPLGPGSPRLVGRLIHQFFLYKKHYKMLLRAKNEASMVVDAFCDTKQGWSNTKNSETWALL